MTTLCRATRIKLGNALNALRYNVRRLIRAYISSSSSTRALQQDADRENKCEDNNNLHRRSRLNRNNSQNGQQIQLCTTVFVYYNQVERPFLSLSLWQLLLRLRIGGWHALNPSDTNLRKRGFANRIQYIAFMHPPL